MTVCDQCGKPADTELHIEVTRRGCRPQVDVYLDLCHKCQMEVTERVELMAKPRQTIPWGLWLATDGKEVKA